MRTANRKPGKFSTLIPDPILTKEKFNELKEKLEKLKKIQPTAAAEVARLAELGDFSENVEYQMAKGRLRSINNNITKLDSQLHAAVIVDSENKGGLVQVGSIVTVSVSDQEKVYKILGSVEADPKKGVISYNSPIGAALIGHKTGDIVAVNLADKRVEYKVLKVE